MWITSAIDRYDEKIAAEDEKKKTIEPLTIGASFVFSDLNTDTELSDLTDMLDRTVAYSSYFYATNTELFIDLTFDGRLLTFRSSIANETDANNIVYARIDEAKNHSGAVIVLSHWNAGMWAYQGLSKHLARFGVTTVELTLPYHGCRNRPDGTFSDYFLSANIAPHDSLCSSSCSGYQESP
jgi:hypothetical protein